VADLAAASILGLIVVPPEFSTSRFIRTSAPPSSTVPRLLKDHPAFRWVEDIYARHRGTSAAVARA